MLFLKKTGKSEKILITDIEYTIFYVETSSELADYDVMLFGITSDYFNNINNILSILIKSDNELKISSAKFLIQKLNENSYYANKTKNDNFIFLINPYGELVEEEI